MKSILSEKSKSLFQQGMIAFAGKGSVKGLDLSILRKNQKFGRILKRRM